MGDIFQSWFLVLGRKFLYNLSFYRLMLVMIFPCPSETQVFTPQWTTQ